MMADTEQLRILKQGVNEWNAWREEHRDIEICLNKAHLSGTTLTDVDFIGAHLTGAVLKEAILDKADLFGAYLARADLTGANLQGADLRAAHITVEQLCQARTLYEAKIDTYLKEMVTRRRPKLFEKP